MNEAPTPDSATPAGSGGHRLAILGIIAVTIAFISSGVSLFIYTASGDIYLDRSRPGFIFDNESPSDDDSTDQATNFSPDGPVTTDSLNNYLQKLDTAVNEITAESDAFSASALSDETLRITDSTN